MNKTELKQLFLQMLLAAVVLLVPLPILFISPQIVASIWSTAIVVLFLKKKQEPELSQNKKYNFITRMLYLQMITWSFAFFFVPVIGLFTIIIPVVTLILLASKKRRENKQLIKWSKYVGLHTFSMMVLLTLLSFFPDIGEVGLFSFSVITFVNSGYMVVYLRLEQRIVESKRRIALIVILLVMASMAMSMFPQESGLSILQQIFGG